MQNERQGNWGRTPSIENLWQSMYKAIMWPLDTCHGRHIQGHSARNSVEVEERFLPWSQTNLLRKTLKETKQNVHAGSRTLEQQLICLRNLP